MSPPERVGAFLHGVAVLVAKKAKTWARKALSSAPAYAERYADQRERMAAWTLRTLRFFAESRQAMEKILASPEGQAAVKDVPNFATGGVSFVYTDVEQLV